MADSGDISKRVQFRERALAVLAVLSLWIWMFWPILVSGKSVGFRDSVYMHYPVLKWTTGEMMAGRLPLWSPYDGAGMPVVGEGSTAIFYPFKAILLLPVCSFVFRYNLFLALHVLLASFTGYWCARRLGCSRLASTFGGLSFGFSGPVLFQVTNQIYLVSAAWLPVAFGCVRDLFRSGLSKREYFRSSTACAMSIAMMVLGGDPQMAAMVIIILAGTIVAHGVIGCINVWRRRSPGPATHLMSFRRLTISLFSVCLVSFLLAAVQIMPLAEFSRYSERAVWDQPRNIFELASAILWPGDPEIPVSASSLVGDPVPGTHHDHIYQFSQPPWSLAELLLPGVGGLPWPENTRWLDSMPGADRMWNASLYQGGLAFLLAVVAVFLPRSRLDWWLIGVGLLFCLASFGWYGIGWFVRESCSASGFPGAFPWLGRPVGGVYWALVTFVPFVSGFRYPAKLFVIATLCMALLAARNLDRMEIRINRQLVVVCLLATMVLCMVALVAGWPARLPDWIQGLSGNSGGVDCVFGPVNPLGSGKLVGRSLIYATCAGLIAVTGIAILGRWSVRSLPGAFLLLLVADLAVCQYQLVPAIDSTVFNRESALATRTGQEPDRVRGYRTVCPAGFPAPNDWKDFGSTHRLEQIAAWQIENTMPRFNLVSRVVRLEFFGSVQPDPNRLPWLPIVSGSQPDQAGPRRIRFWDMKQKRRLFSRAEPDITQWALTPRVFAIAQFPGPDSGRRIDGNALLAADERGEILLPSMEKTFQHEVKPGNSFLNVVDETLDWIETEYEFTSPMVLVLPEGWCGGWSATATVGKNRAVQLAVSHDRAGGWISMAKGSGKLTLAYRPASFVAGAAISLVAWLTFLGMKLVSTGKRRVAICKGQGDPEL